MKSPTKIELLKELQQELENRKSYKSFYNEDFLVIEYDVNYDFICANWKGYQSEKGIMEGCEKILEAVSLFKCNKVLNDNSNVVGIWTPAAAWVAHNWFPRLLGAGVRKFAWVYSPSVLSQVSTDETLSRTEVTQAIKTFKNVPMAMRWLRTTLL
jgi:hypothetical protein